MNYSTWNSSQCWDWDYAWFCHDNTNHTQNTTCENELKCHEFYNNGTCAWKSWIRNCSNETCVDKYYCAGHDYYGNCTYWEYDRDCSYYPDLNGCFQQWRCSNYSLDGYCLRNEWTWFCDDTSNKTTCQWDNMCGTIGGDNCTSTTWVKNCSNETNCAIKYDCTWWDRDLQCTNYTLNRECSNFHDYSNYTQKYTCLNYTNTW